MTTKLHLHLHLGPGLRTRSVPVLEYPFSHLHTVQAERYDDASDGGSSPAPHHHHRSGGNAQYFMTIIPDARALTTARRTSPPALSSASRSRSPAFAVEGRLYLGALPATTGALAYFRDCCETGIEMLNAHNTASNDGEMQRPHNHPHTRTHQDWVLDVVSALEDAAIVRTGTVGLVKACPRRGW